MDPEAAEATPDEEAEPLDETLDEDDSSFMISDVGDDKLLLLLAKTVVAEFSASLLFASFIDLLVLVLVIVVLLLLLLSLSSSIFSSLSLGFINDSQFSLRCCLSLLFSSVDLAVDVDFSESICSADDDDGVVV